MHSHTFPYKEGRVFRDLEGFFLGGGGRGAAIYENLGFPVSNPGLRNLRITMVHENIINNVHTRCIVKTSGFTRGVCKNPEFY